MTHATHNTYMEIGKYECALGHKWEGSITAFTACPICKCASALLQVVTIRKEAQP